MAETKETKSKIITVHTDHFPYVRGDVLNVTELGKQGVKVDIPKAKYVEGEVAPGDLPDVKVTDEEV